MAEAGFGTSAAARSYRRPGRRESAARALLGLVRVSRPQSSLMLDTATLEGNADLMAKVQRELGVNAFEFLKRVYRDGLARYLVRIGAMGLAGRGHVLDAGCGLGQWSFALAREGGLVTGVDVARERVAVCRLLAREAQCQNAAFVTASLERLPFPSDSFDGAISYSVLYFTDYGCAIAEIGRVLRPGGVFYLSTNGIGRYLYDIVHNPFPAADFSPRIYGLRSLANTLLGRRSGLSAQKGTAAMSPKGTIRALRSVGFEVISCGPEGSLGGGDQALQLASFCGITAVFDVLARKR